VGITEGLPVARAELERMNAAMAATASDSENHKTKKVTVLWASRTEADTFWRDEIDELRQTYGNDTFELKHVFSREQRDGCYHGRINPDVVRDAFELKSSSDEQKPNNDVGNDDMLFPLFLAVGTKEMMKMTYGMLESMGYPMPKHELLPKKHQTKK